MDIKCTMSFGGQVTDLKAKKIIDFVNNINDFAEIKNITEEEAIEKGLLNYIGEDVDKAYIEKVKGLTIREDLVKDNAKDLKIIYTPIHGSGNIPVRRVLNELGYENLTVVKEQELPKINKGDKFTVKEVIEKKGETKPPARFNEGTLLSAMENPHKYINVDKESAKTLGETGGLGTVATRADIIDKLFNSFVIEKKGKDIIPTSKGKQLIDLVPKELKSPLLTAKWEGELDKISKGKEDPRKFTKEMRKTMQQL